MFFDDPNFYLLDLNGKIEKSLYMINCREYMEKQTYFELPNPFHVFRKNGHAIQLGDVQSLKFRTFF